MMLWILGYIFLACSNGILTIIMMKPFHFLELDP